MRIDRDEARQLLRQGEFGRLFTQELGWDQYRGRLTVFAGGETVNLAGVAEKRGLAVLVCPAADGKLPAYTTRRKIDHEVTRSHREHLIIFTDSAGQQIWQWVKREPGKPAQCREHRYNPTQDGEALIQKLEGLAVSLDEEEGLTLTAVTGFVRAAFDLAPVTRRFYDRFKDEHAAFAGFLAGIPDEGLARWYVSVMLNRLMFLYFIQKKGFLGGGDRDYLRGRLAASQAVGPDRYYREFLCPLFFAGLAVPAADRDAATNELLGELPYLNGGIFMPHQVEERHGPSIAIPDAAFQRLFEFFDQYHWHLDERPLRQDNEINPDVLGYIFEKYINQKQMGAYYTQEDITEYISKNSIIPFLFDAARRACKIAFEGDTAVWRLLRDDPDRYLYPAVRHGAELPLPDYIAKGIDHVPGRERWNETADPAYALPTEIWREVVARRQRYETIRARLAAGEVQDINDLITLNLDIRQFAQDVIETCEGQELLRAFFQAIARVTVLDPTCGSGAFLFAALNILEPLYEACLDRMEGFVEEPGAASAGRRPEPFADFREVLARVADHPNRSYFVLKSIVVNNLFGVDIMEEAVEICKLRLFLKLAAQVEPDRRRENLGIEPLPDIDFNIQAGNTLVGFTRYDEVEAAIHYGGLDFDGNGPRIRAAALQVHQAMARFRGYQEDWRTPPQVFAAEKAKLREKLAALRAELDRYLAGQYGVEPTDEGAFAAWRQSHQPFHWYTEFCGIMESGGFDVIIGNPPYVARSKVGYRTRDPRAAKFADIYADVALRCLDLTGERGRGGLIVPLSLTFSGQYAELRQALAGWGRGWFASFDNIPAALFAGVSQRCTVWLGAAGGPSAFAVTPMHRWCASYRPHLLDTLAYHLLDSGVRVEDALPKIGGPAGARALRAFSLAPGGTRASWPPVSLWTAASARNFVGVALAPPPVLDASTLAPLDDGGAMRQLSAPSVGSAVAALAGEFAFAHWLSLGDGFHVTASPIESYLSCLRHVDNAPLALLTRLGDLLHQRRHECLVFKRNAGKYVGNYCYRGLFAVTRRADLLIMAGLGLSRGDALDIFDHVQRVLAINVRAGERAIPSEVKDRFPPLPVDEAAQQALFDEVDRVLAEHYGFTDEELDFIINYDIKYRLGADEAED